MLSILNWNEFLQPYKQAVDELTLKFQSIIDEYMVLGFYSPLESVSGRVKKSNSIMEKAAKKNIPINRIEEDIEDIAGIRILCKFVEDIRKTIKIVRERDGIDLTILEERDYITNTKPSGYRSFHFIIKYPIMTARGYKEVLAEIQIRTLAMDFWAKAEHMLKYKHNGNIPKELQDRLFRSAEAAFNLDVEMGTIRTDIMDAERLNERKDSLIISIIENLRKINVNEKSKDVALLDDYFIKVMESGELLEMEKFNNKLLSILEEGNMV